jgi:protein-S-isoprenylcysteine O-methyltransferase Ste14
MQSDKGFIIKGLFKYLLTYCITMLALFLSSGTISWSGAWIIIGFSLFYMTFLFTFGMKYFPETLLVRAKTTFVYSWDKAAILIYTISFYTLYIIAGIDFRYSWSSFPLAIIILGICMYFLGLLITFWVLATNPYATGSARIQKDDAQKVITSGPYKFVRHPMYFTTVMFAISTPFILDSVWATIISPIIILTFMFRCYKEDILLQKELDGYCEYTKKVKQRMIPFIW